MNMPAGVVVAGYGLHSRLTPGRGVVTANTRGCAAILGPAEMPDGYVLPSVRRELGLGVMGVQVGVSERKPPLEVDAALQAA